MLDYSDDCDLASIKLLATDLDLTLYDDEGKEPEGLVDAIHRLTQAGVVFCPASGRPEPQIRALFEENADEIAICGDNGGITTYRGEVVSEFPIAPELYRAVMEACIESGSGVPMLCAVDTVYVLERDRSHHDVFRYYFPNIVYVDSYDDLDVEADKISLYYPDHDSEEAYATIFGERFSASLHVTCAGREWLDFMENGVNKGSGIAGLCSHLGIDLADAAAAGDTYNDIEMLHTVGHSFLVANAEEHMREHARFGIPSNNEGGVLTLIQAILAAKDGENG